MIAVVKTTDAWSNAWTIRPLTSHSGYIYALAIDPCNTHIVYAGGEYYDRSGNWHVALFRSSDGGSEWHDISSGIDDQSRPVYALAVSQNVPNTIYAGTSAGIYKSTGGGSSWNNINCGFDTVSSLCVDSSSPETIYAGTPEGVYRSGDGGLNWKAMDPGFSLFQVSVLAADPVLASRVYAGTRGEGLFTHSTVGLEYTESPTFPQNGAILDQNSPNPFSKFCTIGYFLPVCSHISLRIYDVAGGLVRELVDQSVEAGRHAVTWDGRDESRRPVPSTVYFYRLQGAGFTMTKKMLLIR